MISDNGHYTSARTVCVASYTQEDAFCGLVACSLLASDIYVNMETCLNILSNLVTMSALLSSLF